MHKHSPESIYLTQMRGIADSRSPICNQSTLAIVMPVYNVANYIRESICSILSQTMMPDELIVVNDGSTDLSGEVLADYSGYPFIRIINILNSGLGPARNLGRCLAKSQYIYFFDSDDLLDPAFVATIKLAIVNNSFPDLVLFGGESFCDPGDLPDISNYTFKKTITGRFCRGGGLLGRLVSLRQDQASACLYVVRNTLMSSCRIQFPPIIHEDEAVFMPLLALSESTVVLPNILFFRRIRPGSITTRALGDENANGLLCVMHLIQYHMSRDRAAIAVDYPIWRCSLGQYAVRYVYLCRVTGAPIAWPALLSVLIQSRSSYSLLRCLAYALIGDRAGRIMKLNRKLVRAMACRVEVVWRKLS